jgi:lysozyme
MAGAFKGVIDVSHLNGDVDLARAHQDGVAGVIQEAPESQQYVDPAFQTNRRKAKKAGQLWGGLVFDDGSTTVVPGVWSTPGRSR